MNQAQWNAKMWSVPQNDGLVVRIAMRVATVLNRPTKEFRQTTCKWLRFAGRLREPDRVPAPHQEEIDALCRYSEVERGLSPATIATVRQSLGKFFRQTRVQQLSSLTIADVERFLVLLGKQGWTRHGIRSMAHQLRLFFRFGEQMAWTKPGMAASIHGPRVYQHEQLPLGPSWPDVQRLLASTETNRKVDIRDRPILLLLAVYGLRVSEVQRLRLEDVKKGETTMKNCQVINTRPTFRVPLRGARPLQGWALRLVSGV